MSNHTSLNDVRLDRAIDRAVRELMQIDPAPGMRRRVLSRINAPVERRALPGMRYAFAATALVVLVLSITLMPGRVEPPAPPKAPPLVFAGGVPPVASLPTDSLPATQSSSPQVTRERIAMPRIGNVFSPQRSGVSAATVREPDVIGVAPETLAPLTIVPLSARPILIEPLVIGTPQKSGR